MGGGQVVLVVQHCEKKPHGGDPGLTDESRRQASDAGRWISERFLVAQVWSSPLRRTRETASEVASWAGRRVLIDQRLAERMNWEGPASQPLESFLERLASLLGRSLLCA